MIDTINTIITINDKTITLPYQTILNKKLCVEDETFRIGFGSLDTKLDISKQLQIINDEATKDRRNGFVEYVEVVSGNKVLKMNKVMITETVYSFGRFFELECAKDKYDISRLEIMEKEMA